MSQRLGLAWPEGLEISEVEKAAAILLLLIHKGFNNSVWGSKRLRYWGAYEEKISLCLGAQTLAEFAHQFAGEMSARVGRNGLQREIATTIVWSREQADILDCIGRQSKMLVTLVTVIRDSIKAQYDHDDESEETNSEHNELLYAGDRITAN